MPQPKNAMEIFQLLDKSNCRKCGEKTCLAFAGAVFRGRTRLEECPKLDRQVIKRFSSTSESQFPVEDEGVVYLKTLKEEIGGIDLAKAAERIGARFLDNRLTLKVFGKDFGVDSKGNLYTDIHMNPWVAVPFLNYIIRGKGVAATGNWVSFRELKDGKERYLLFKKRCEEAMKRVADVYTGFFDDMVHLFCGRQVEKQFESDISVVLHPLPKIPIMVCYWLPEEGLESSLNLFFDETADKNLDIGSIFTLGVGLAQMFGKLALRHGFPESLSPQHISNPAL
ncbi:MAG: DUF3786 domain-containing protein [Pseudomonadota bacterium]